MKDADMATEPRYSKATRPRLRLALILGAVLVVLVAAVLITLHVRSGDPGTAKRQPVGLGDDRRANTQIEHRAERFVAALKSGNVATIRSLAYDSTDRAQAAPLVAAFGNRTGLSGTVQVDEFGGGNGVLTISVPCRSSQPQQVIIPFEWKRTNWISSGWFAVISPLGMAGVPAAGCARP